MEKSQQNMKNVVMFQSVCVIGIPKHWYVLFVCVLSSVSLGGGVDPRSCPLCAALGLVGCIQSPLTTLLSQIQ